MFDTKGIIQQTDQHMPGVIATGSVILSSTTFELVYLVSWVATGTQQTKTQFSDSENAEFE